MVTADVSPRGRSMLSAVHLLVHEVPAMAFNIIANDSGPRRAGSCYLNPPSTLLDDELATVADSIVITKCKRDAGASLLSHPIEAFSANRC